MQYVRPGGTSTHESLAVASVICLLDIYPSVLFHIGEDATPLDDRIALIRARCLLVLTSVGALLHVMTLPATHLPE